MTSLTDAGKQFKQFFTLKAATTSTHETVAPTATTAVAGAVTTAVAWTGVAGLTGYAALATGVSGLTMFSAALLCRSIYISRKKGKEGFKALSIDNVAGILERFSLDTDFTKVEIDSVASLLDENEKIFDINNLNSAYKLDDETKNDLIYVLANVHREEAIVAFNTKAQALTEKLKDATKVNAQEITIELTNLKNETAIALTEQNKHIKEAMEQYFNDAKLRDRFGDSYNSIRIELLDQIEEANKKISEDFNTAMTEKINELSSATNAALSKAFKYGRLATNPFMRELIIANSKQQREEGEIGLTGQEYEDGTTEEILSIKGFDFKEGEALKTVTGREFQYHNGTFVFNHPRGINFIYNHLAVSTSERKADYQSLMLAARAKFETVNINVKFPDEKVQQKRTIELIDAAVAAGFQLNEIKINGKKLDEIKDDLFKGYESKLPQLQTKAQNVKAMEEKIFKNYEKQFEAATKATEAPVADATATNPDSSPSVS